MPVAPSARWALLLAVGAVLCLADVAVDAREPGAETLQRAVDAAFKEALLLDDGETAQYIPALAAADPEGFALALVTVDGRVVARGDLDRVFAIMSAAKPFTLAHLLEARGTDFVLERIGVEPSGQPFNSVLAMALNRSRTANPMVNAGAIAVVSHLPAESPAARWLNLRGFLSRMAGAELELLDDVYKSVSTSNYRNRAIASLLVADGWLGSDADAALEVYNRQSCLGVNTVQLATMGATLANGGVVPGSAERVLAAELVDEVLAVMLMAGFYDESGAWAYQAGLPAKSGVGGGIVAVVPGRMAIAAYSPRLNESGNSVRALAAIAYLSNALSLSLFRAGEGSTNP
jgi:glutaminase